ncbi:hypothetical protein, partial [Alicyclobacillus fodiniaquatilis]
PPSGPVPPKPLYGEPLLAVITPTREAHPEGPHETREEDKMKTQIIMETEDATNILKRCGHRSFIVWCAIQALETPCTIEEIGAFCGLTIEEAKEAAERLGMFLLGILTGQLNLMEENTNKFEHAGIQ